MAERSNFSVRHISRLFYEHVGMTPGVYVERVRLEAARTMLEGGDEDLSVVAASCGLGSVETLRRAFVREFGVPPGRTAPSSELPEWRETVLASASRRLV